MTQVAYYTNCELRTIDLSAGAVEYLWVDYEDSLLHNIQADPVSISLGTFTAPGTWHAADLRQQNGAVWKVRAALLIGAVLTYPVGTYYAWLQVTDTPETIVQLVSNRLVQIT